MKKFGWLLLGLMAWPLVASAEDRCVIVTPSWAARTNQDGTGYYFDLVRAVYEPIGIPVNFRIVPWNRAMEMVAHADADLMLGLFYNPQSPEAARWVHWPFDNEITVAVYKKALVPQWQGEKSLEHQKVIWPRGYNYYKFLSVVVDWAESDDVPSGLSMLAVDRARFFMLGKNGYLTLPSGTLDPKVYTYQEVINNGLYPSFANTEAAQRLARLWDERMPVLVADGTIARIYKKYGQEAPALKARP